MSILQKMGIDVSSLSREEKLQAMETLWRDLSADEEDIPSPDWHVSVLEERTKSVAEGRDQFLTLEEATDRLRDTR